MLCTVLSWGTHEVSKRTYKYSQTPTNTDIKRSWFIRRIRKHQRSDTTPLEYSTKRGNWTPLHCIVSPGQVGPPCCKWRDEVSIAVPTSFPPTKFRLMPAQSKASQVDLRRAGIGTDWKQSQFFSPCHHYKHQKLILQYLSLSWCDHHPHH